MASVADLAHTKRARLTGSLEIVADVGRLIYEGTGEGGAFKVLEISRVGGKLLIKVPNSNKFEGPPFKCPVVGCRKETTSANGMLNHGTRDHKFSFWTWKRPRRRAEDSNSREFLVVYRRT